MAPESDPHSNAIALWFAAVGAIVTAFSLAYIAHDDLGLTRREIRIPSVITAVIIGLVLATDYFGKKLRKPK